MHAASLSALEKKAGLKLVCACECAQNMEMSPCFCFKSLQQMSVFACISFFPSCYSVTAGCVAMATTILKRAALFPNCRLKENRRQKQVSLHTFFFLLGG